MSTHIRKFKTPIDIGIFFVLIIVLAAMLTRVGINVQPALANRSAQERASEALPPLTAKNLFYVPEQSLILLAAQVDNLSELAEAPRLVESAKVTSWGTEATEVVEEEVKPDPPQAEAFGHDGPSVVSDLAVSPDGLKMAVQSYFGMKPVGWIVNLENREQPVMTRFTAEGRGIFLGWHPDSRHVLYRVSNVDVTNPGLWIVDTADGTHQLIKIENLTAPEQITDAAFSPDGSQIVYALSRSMGMGSEIWRTDATGEKHELLLQDELKVAADLTWSPDGSKIAFVNLLDSPVPFAEAGLMVMDGSGQNLKALAAMDGGHGQAPLWRSDSQALYFVARENVQDSAADYEAEKLVSSIRSVNVATGEQAVLVPADGARQIDLSLTPEGNLLFASNRQGQLDVWSASPDGRLQQVTNDGKTQRHPVSLQQK